jgi:phosphate acetyltransferase
MILDELKQKVQGKKIRLVFTEGNDYRIQEAAQHLVADDILCSCIIRK